VSIPLAAVAGLARDADPDDQTDQATSRTKE
jgi:hypothetical protein